MEGSGMERTVAAEDSTHPGGGAPEPSKRPWRDLVAFWLLGLCNNYGYVVMLSAAHDILSNEYNKVADEVENAVNTSANSSIRDCNTMSTGAILLADILPSLVVKIFAPFLMCSIQNVVSTWSSGTGGAGIFGAGSYAGLTALGLKPADALLVMLIVPVIMALSFWVLLQHPSPINLNMEKNELRQLSQAYDISTTTQKQPAQQDETAVRRLRDKLSDIPPLLKYMIPLTAVYLFEYFINQGLFELIEFDITLMSHKEQYRWLQLTYQVGVFISRSSVNIVTFRHVWIMAVLQFLNVILFVFQVIYEFIPNIWIVFTIVLWEGLLGGAAYVNTFYTMSLEVTPEKREFSTGITTLSDTAGITLAGFIAMPVHNVLCKLPRIS